MDYLSIEDGRGRPGLRMVLSRGAPNPWGEGAKAILHLKGIPFLPVAQEPGQEQAELLEWTGQTSAPVAMYADEKPRPRWNQILLLAERLAPEPRLIPEDEADRTTMFGLLHEILDEDGFMWNKRVLGLSEGKRMVETQAPPKGEVWRSAESFAHRLDKYSNRESEEHCHRRFHDVLGSIERLLLDQRARGSRYLIGEALSAADMYWAAVTNSFLPLPVEQCPVVDKFRARRRANPDPFNVLPGLDPIVLEHRNFIVTSYFKLPMDF